MKGLKVFSHHTIHIFDTEMPIQTVRQIVNIATIKAATLQRRLWLPEVLPPPELEDPLPATVLLLDWSLMTT